MHSEDSGLHPSAWVFRQSLDIQSWCYRLPGWPPMTILVGLLRTTASIIHSTQDRTYFMHWASTMCHSTEIPTGLDDTSAHCLVPGWLWLPVVQLMPQSHEHPVKLPPHAFETPQFPQWRKDKLIVTAVQTQRKLMHSFPVIDELGSPPLIQATPVPWLPLSSVVIMFI